MSETTNDKKSIFQIPLTLKTAIITGVISGGIAGWVGANLAVGQAASVTKTTDYATVIENNPDAVYSALQQWQVNQEKAKATKIAAVLADSKEAIFNNDLDPFIGPKNAEKIIVEFYDYNCGFCRKSLSTIQKIKKENPDVKVIFKEFPILGPGSVETSVISSVIWDNYPDKWYQYHESILSLKGRADKHTALNVVEEIGLDPEKIDKIAHEEKYSKYMNTIRELASEMNVTGTPAFIVNNKIIPGAVSAKTLIENL